MGTFIVTGASAGIGREVALTLARRQHRVLALARSSERLLEIAALDRHIVPLTTDLSDASAIAALADRLKDEAIDGLFNNAAIQWNVAFAADGYGPDEITAEIATNLAAPILLTHLVARMAKRPLIVVNINSGLGLFPKSTSAVYSATKAGLRMFGRAIAAQGGGNIRVVDVILPLVDTAMTAGRGTGKLAPKTAAAAIVAALDSQQREVYVGKAKALRILARIAPSIAGRIMRRM
ncbi:SDR family NAD(P)-dependent oxidoreductase [Peteryoungia desertarenae]|uniref:SDR family NAD(P)-dependent oxidoreductase n=1 Tax=Peteryoungia desertarenae TaxID=1813451 RepID=A0ABX6QMB7_9HYPH|nr:SDR family NAD(P)-dependent oxidoreductase [Peteryoungia desertarenae]QLF69758.1 SDR family NAD(P)-dependent oxidoreductase [Peteryoungia desertarenae]